MQTYHIPTNFKDAGYIFNGMIAVRNAVDAVIFGLLGFIIAWALPFEGDGAISGYILFIGLFAMLGIAGIRGIPVSVYVVDAIRWQGRRKPFLYNHHGASFSKTAAEVMLTEPQLRDKVADALDKMRNSLASNRREYIEGETFRFAEDPELEALKFAEEQLLENEAQPTKVKDTEEPETAEEDTEINTVDFGSIAKNIVLRDIDNGD